MKVICNTCNILKLKKKNRQKIVNEVCVTFFLIQQNMNLKKNKNIIQKKLLDKIPQKSKYINNIGGFISPLSQGNAAIAITKIMRQLIVISKKLSDLIVTEMATLIKQAM